jgi:hypothetical protein
LFDYQMSLRDFAEATRTPLSNATDLSAEALIAPSRPRLFTNSADTAEGVKEGYVVDLDIV